MSIFNRQGVVGHRLWPLNPSSCSTLSQSRADLGALRPRIAKRSVLPKSVLICVLLRSVLLFFFSRPLCRLPNSAALTLLISIETVSLTFTLNYLSTANARSQNSPPDPDGRPDRTKKLACCRTAVPIWATAMFRATKSAKAEECWLGSAIAYTCQVRVGPWVTKFRVSEKPPSDERSPLHSIRCHLLNSPFQTTN